jgi:hypothetical protein
MLPWRRRSRQSTRGALPITMTLEVKTGTYREAGGIADRNCPNCLATT